MACGVPFRHVDKKILHGILAYLKTLNEDEWPTSEEISEQSHLPLEEVKHVYPLVRQQIEMNKARERFIIYLKQEFEDVIEEADINVIRYKKFDMRPMTPEEAILQMNMLGHNFFMFKNAADGNVNVVYQRADEGYAVLQPKE